MAHFRGRLTGSRGEVSRFGTKKSGIHACLSTCTGHIHCDVQHNVQTGKDHYNVFLTGLDGHFISLGKGIMP